MNISEVIAKELQVNISQIDATVALLDEGATVPFIARYRKEATGGLSDTDLRQLAERLTYLRELLERRETILKSIEEQGKLTDALKKDILAAETKTRLEDLYLPYKPKRRTKAQIAREAGLEPLALHLLKDTTCTPEVEAKAYINEEKGVKDESEALEGARQILMEVFSENADLLEELRDFYWQHAIIQSKVADKKEQEGIKFADYFDFNESIHKIPSHRLLAIFRGRNEKMLNLQMLLPEESMVDVCLNTMANKLEISTQLSKNHWLWQTLVWTWKIKLQLKLETDWMMELKKHADEDAINVFRDNLKNLLMAAPAGNHVVLGLDPGFRTGVKTVVIDGTGKLLLHTVIFPHAPQNQWDKALHTLGEICKQCKVKLISIGNGTASRETDKLAAELMTKHPELSMSKIVVSEAGASVYSASEFAAKEFPDLDVSYRGAVSIARRLQDPLAELVKIDPKSIGVGQYQHDVNQVKLEHSLKATMEDCVNAVGADVNTASVPLLTSISGLNETIANNIVKFREEKGRFTHRDTLKSVPRLGDKTFEQAAGFLRIMDGENPLDGSAVHPESYPVVETIAKHLGISLKELIGNETLLNSADPKKFVTTGVGLPTVIDIIKELKKPGRDPRPEFIMAKFAEGIHEMSQLKPGMELEGVVTNVANFGAFVDIGVHQDGLVHISEAADRFVKDVHEVLKVGQIVKVRVLEVNTDKKRISLTMKSKDNKAQGQPQQRPQQQTQSKSNHAKSSQNNTLGSAFGDQLREALKSK